ncbi:hypothetical protein [Heliophilum fasciatum]|uniref:Uncharacterized protein n=1 Tax=Heliophilum fasciatum TaxID=35700 RepID=A0A4R2RQC6_9FIRM|nr:hypothetical protein [Heliophilum fasciatum]MCW2277590.1 ribosomal protein L37AE/L43A [Heliophilum fasciatum]TCP64939.1 hypothetical protein EDD73_1079 [Heliophilum fasciatum]
MNHWQTVECTECGTVRNRVPSHRVTDELRAEMERTHLCPYCEHTEARPLEEGIA